MYLPNKHLFNLLVVKAAVDWSHYKLCDICVARIAF